MFFYPPSLYKKNFLPKFCSQFSVSKIPRKIIWNLWFYWQYYIFLPQNASLIRRRERKCLTKLRDMVFYDILQNLWLMRFRTTSRDWENLRFHARHPLFNKEGVFRWSGDQEIRRHPREESGGGPTVSGERLNWLNNYDQKAFVLEFTASPDDATSHARPPIWWTSQGGGLDKVLKIIF